MADNSLIQRWGKTPDDPYRIYIVAGQKLLRQDLLTTGEMLEAEAMLGTWDAARLFQQGIGGEYGWGHTEGGGNVLLPLAAGGTVDINWLNVLMSAGMTLPDSASLGYTIGKLGWAIAHGIIRKSWQRFKGHLQAFGNPAEVAAVRLAGRYDIEHWTFRKILHPILVDLSDQVVQEARSANHLKSKTGSAAQGVKREAWKVFAPNTFENSSKLFNFSEQARKAALKSAEEARQRFNQMRKQHEDASKRLKDLRPSLSITKPKMSGINTGSTNIGQTIRWPWRRPIGGGASIGHPPIRPAGPIRSAQPAWSMPRVSRPMSGLNGISWSVQQAPGLGGATFKPRFR